jgi:ribosome-associated protein
MVRGSLCARRYAIDSFDRVLKAWNFAKEKQAENPLVLELKNLSSIADYFVILSAESERQAKSIADEIVHQFKQMGVYALGVEGAETAKWILVDYGDIVIHIFLPQVREYYELERIWRDAPVIDLNHLNRRAISHSGSRLRRA